MGRTKNTENRKSVQVSTSISPELHKALMEYRWSARLEGMTEILRAALEEYAVNHEIAVAAESPETDDK